MITADHTRRRLAALASLVLLGSVLLAASGPTVPARGAARPNFVVLMTDDQTNSEMPAMKKTLAQIGARGVSFDRFINTFPLCCPSRATFLTGQFSHNNGVLGNGTPVGGYPALDKRDTIGSWLQKAGYYTIQVGKYLNGYPLASDPTEVPPGWDDWHGAIDSTDNAENQYYDYALNDNGVVHHFGDTAADYRTDVYADRAVAAIDARGAAVPSGRPFFMFVALSAPHLPATPAPSDRGRFAHLSLPRELSYNEADVSDKPSFIRKRRRFSAATKRQIVTNFRRAEESLLSVDRADGRIVDALRDNGMLGNTYVIFLSDQGFFLASIASPRASTSPTRTRSGRR